LQLFFSAPFTSILSNHCNKSASGRHQISGQSVQVKNVKVNATDDPFLAFTTVQQIMISCAVTDKEKVAVITEVVLDC
jgi:hypothetical protein